LIYAQDGSTLLPVGGVGSIPAASAQVLCEAGPSLAHSAWAKRTKKRISGRKNFCRLARGVGKRKADRQANRK